MTGTLAVMSTVGDPWCFVKLGSGHLVVCHLADLSESKERTGE